MKAILVATDGSECGTAALKAAAEKASAAGAQLVVLAVTARDLETRPLSEEIGEYARVERLAGGEAEARRVLAEDVLAEAKAIVGDRPELDALYVLRTGNAAQEILACARERAADMLFLGSRGRGLLGAFFLGSVSREVAGAAGCPVVIVPKGR